jgi:cysteine desulfurase/selenocysteine lyase
MLNLRPDFPILTNNPDLVYLDSAASAQKPRAVIDAITHFYSNDYANVHRGTYGLSINSTQKYEEAREKIARFIDAPSSREVIFTRSATESLNLLAAILGENLKPQDEIVLSVLEHHANLIPWQQVAKKTNAQIKFAKISSSGGIDLENLSGLITENTKVVSLSHCSNVLGSITPLLSVREILKRKGSAAFLIADASQSVPHFPVSVANLGVDFLVFSGHKLYGPSGIGILWGKEKWLRQLPPYQTGGDMIRSVSLESATWNDLPWKFEAGTPNIEGAIALGAAVDYLESTDLEFIKQHTQKLTQIAYAQLSNLPEVTILGNPDSCSGIMSFCVDGMHPHDIAGILNEHQICIRAGFHCAAPLHAALGINASNRLSVGIYNTPDDIQRFIIALKQAIADFSHV